MLTGHECVHATDAEAELGMQMSKQDRLLTSAASFCLKAAKYSWRELLRVCSMVTSPRKAVCTQLYICRAGLHKSICHSIQKRNSRMQTDNRCKKQVYGQRMSEQMHASPSMAAAWQPERQAVPCVDSRAMW